MTPEQAMAGLSAVVGGGGISAIMVALLGFMTEARKGRKPSEGAVSIAVQSGLADSKWPEIQAGHLQIIAFAMLKSAAIQEIEAEKASGDGAFHDRLDAKMDRVLIDALKVSLRAP